MDLISIRSFYISQNRLEKFPLRALTIANHSLSMYITNRVPKQHANNGKNHVRIDPSAK
jgi:hypothetical protein